MASISIIGRLPEENVSLLHRPGEHHGLLVVHVVVGRPVHHQVLLVRQLSRLKKVQVSPLTSGSLFLTLAVTSLLW